VNLARSSAKNAAISALCKSCEITVDTTFASTVLRQHAEREVGSVSTSELHEAANL